MGHVQTRVAILDDDATVQVAFSFGPDARHLHDCGALAMRPTDFNTLDRLLTAGASRVDSYTYEGPAPRPRLLDLVDDRGVPEDEVVLPLAKGARR